MSNMRQAATHTVPVLIVGGGPVGLSTALALSRFGVRSLLVERHPATSIHPKARGINVRTMELFRQWEIEPAVRAAGLPAEQLQFMRAATLTSRDFSRSRSDWTPETLQAISPTSGVLCSQDVLEPVLLNRVRHMGLAQIEFGTQLTRFQQHARGVTATLTDGATGEQRIVQAAYVVAADGAASGARDSLDIAMVGPELAYSVSILFRADLATTVADRASAVYFVANPDISGVFMAVNNQDRWLFGTRYRPALGERAEDFTAARCTDLVRKAVGLADLPVQIESILPWTAAARVAQQFRGGRVFLAGDAAHQMTPMGAFGMNTGIQDGHNLAWKLAGVLGGWAGADLLNTYQAERQPVAIMTVEQSRKLWESGGPDNVDSNLAVVLGFAYQSTAVVLDGQAPLDEVDSMRAARLGARAPHVWLFRRGRRISTLDLFGSSFVLLAGPSGRAWCEAAERVSRQLAVPLQALVVGASSDLADPAGTWCETYGVSEAGAVLVRPDGHVAWRQADQADAPQAELLRVLQLLLMGHPIRLR